MSEDAVGVNIEILDKEFMIACPEDEREELLESARLLNERMKQVRDGGKVFGAERIAVITALNVIHEFVRQERNHDVRLSTVGAEVQRLEEKVRKAIGRRATAEALD